MTDCLGGQSFRFEKYLKAFRLSVLLGGIFLLCSFFSEIPENNFSPTNATFSNINSNSITHNAIPLKAALITNSENNTKATSSSALPCILTAAGESTVCNDNGTDDPIDDTYTVFLNPTGTDLSATYSVSGDIIAGNIAYGASIQIGGSFLISSGNLSLSIVDDFDPTCIFNILIAAPQPCSPCPVPYLLCPGDSLEATIQAGLINVQWYLDTGLGACYYSCPGGNCSST